MSPSPPIPLPNNPKSKLPPISKGHRIHKLPLPLPPPSHRSLNPLPLPSATTSTRPDKDGYLPPPRLPQTTIIKVSSSASFISLVKRVRKALDSKHPASSKSKHPLPTSLGRRNGGGGGGGILEDAHDDVVLIATGKAIQKAVEVGGFFTREKELVVVARTRTVTAVDEVLDGEGEEVEVEHDEGEGEGSRRVRGVSCLEVGVRWVR
ncbi:Rpp20 subunit of nuclear RNase MRP and P-domain-containing protein [Cladorrhinum sp. PSN332]|nr:Rpp20 subunit of nuclear RNase MRP and P-domain-containing protein [Cladorrhinum sp. PSN332]